VKLGHGLGLLYPPFARRASTPAPTLTAVSPDWGLVGGGIRVDFTGTNFTGASGATVNGQSLTGFTVDSPTAAHGTVPAATGSTAVALTSATITTPGGTATLTNAWTYLPASPSLILLSNVGVTGTTTITKWADQSGSSNDFNQNGGLAAPALITNVLNGLPAVRFTSSGHQSLELGDGVAANYPLSRIVTASAYTYYLMLIWRSPIGTNSSNSYANEAVWSDETNGVFGYHAKSSGPTAIAYQFHGADLHADQTIATSTAYVASVKYDGANLKHWKNGGSVATTASGNVDSVARNLRMGIDFTQSIYADLDLLAALAFKTAHSDADRGVIESWLGHRGGIF